VEEGIKKEVLKTWELTEYVLARQIIQSISNERKEIITQMYDSPSYTHFDTNEGKVRVIGASTERTARDIMDEKDWLEEQIKHFEIKAQYFEKASEKLNSFEKKAIACFHDTMDENEQNRYRQYLWGAEEKLGEEIGGLIHADKLAHCQNIKLKGGEPEWQNEEQEIK
jgi:hypothetical protein